MRMLSVLLCATLLAACTRVKTDTLYLVTPHIQAVSGQPVYSPSEALGFAFYAGAGAWAVTSYAHAEAGILENRTTGELRGYNLHSTLDSLGKLSFRLTASPAILVVCDPVNRRYAWREVTVAENLPVMQVPLYFRLWRQDSVYTEMRWTVVSPFAGEDEAASADF